MGRGAGYLALWCGIANGAEDILLPERYDYDEQKIVNHIIENRKRGKKHHIIVNAEDRHLRAWQSVLRLRQAWRRAQQFSDTCSAAEARPVRTVFMRFNDGRAGSGPAL